MKDQRDDDTKNETHDDTNGEMESWEKRQIKDAMSDASVGGSRDKYRTGM